MMIAYERADISSNFVETYRKYYMPDYEYYVYVNPAKQKEVTYFSSPTGLVAANVEESLYETNQLYYILTDHLGSITQILSYWYIDDTNQGWIVQGRATYDAWGRMRNIVNSANPYELLPTSDAMGLFKILERGYTGHEHLIDHDIINMNGRIYDPITAQFLQPDNNVQTPEDFLGYDRYGYCRYNPFKYVDPSGESIDNSLYEQLRMEKEEYSITADNWHSQAVPSPYVLLYKIGDTYYDFWGNSQNQQASIGGGGGSSSAKSSWLSGAWSAVKGFFKAVGNAISGWAKSVWNGLQSGYNWAYGSKSVLKTPKVTIEPVTTNRYDNGTLITDENYNSDPVDNSGLKMYSESGNLLFNTNYIGENNDIYIINNNNISNLKSDLYYSSNYSNERDIYNNLFSYDFYQGLADEYGTKYYLSYNPLYGYNSLIALPCFGSKDVGFALYFFSSGYIAGRYGVDAYGDIMRNQYIIYNSGITITPWWKK